MGTTGQKSANINELEKSINFIKNYTNVPIIPVGYILYQTGLINQLRTLEVIGWMSLIFGILLYISDKTKITKKIETEFNNKSAIFIGLFQVISLTSNEKWLPSWIARPPEEQGRRR